MRCHIGFSRELGDYNICVNALTPGLVMSEPLVASGSHDDAIQARVLASRAFSENNCLRICSAR